MSGAGRKVKRLLVGVTAALVFFSIVPDALPITQNVSRVKAASIKIVPKNVTLMKGQRKKLKVTGTKKKVTWSISNRKIAEIKKDGTLVAKSGGSANITANVGGKKYKGSVRVETPKLSAASKTLKVGQTYNLKLLKTKQKVTWSSSRSSIATVTQKGKVTAKKSGSTTITATVSGKKFTCRIKVNAKTEKPNQSVSASHKKLKNFILSYGDRNSSGNRFIKLTDARSGYTYGIVYESAYDRFSFVGVMNETEASLAFAMNVEIVRSDLVKPELVFSVNNSYAGFKATAEFKASKYKRNSKVYFTINTYAGNVSESGIQETANLGLQLSFMNWDYLLRSQTGLSMKDIGFTSYK